MKLIKNGLVLDSQKGFEARDILIDSGRITRIDKNIEVSEKDCEVLDAEGFYVVPGFIDVHTHGAAGIDIMKADPNRLNELSLFLASKGVTSFLATVMTDSKENIDRALENIRLAMERGLRGAKIAGINMEGPFINPKYRGAHTMEHILKPDAGIIDEFIGKSGNNIRLVTAAPELDGILEIIQKCQKENIVLSAGHSGIDFAGAKEAFRNGFKHVTHLFNAMTGIHHREPGLSGAALDSENVTVEVIPDLIHVHGAVIQMIVKCKTPDKVILITDSILASGLGDGKLKFAGGQIMVKDGVAAFENGVLAGSTLTMIDGIRNMVKELGFSLEDVIKMVSENPAKLINVLTGKAACQKEKMQIL
ncbi:N-acetylglucosamine-6-phosphate deacetylase [Acetivibrio straminisolvens]|uniref:N-acetylglucosamine-6-phosphate deacetylase n=1 Tax=Acetivibrio straminisolvens JCM 21531 TaxID=1294263 RepID=W4V957_9FIRM|nr:N-acetylglucosamine-6-phosphate deacetylase [Acetivibrio straminisolvens]GAE89706.1 N-acetylglucosamine-6-phosphate deacetylase [Acetivibrio straminisolvens JCM 21531]